MNATFDLIAIGGSTWDSIITADDTTVLEEAGKRYLAYPYGQKVYLEQAYFGYGGGAANVAVGAARLGMKSAFLGAIGYGHISESIIENFATEGVSTKLVKRDTEHASGLSIILTAPDGERSILLYRGANNHLTDADIDWRGCTDTQWLYVSSLSGESDKLYDKVAETARQHGIKLAINPGATQIRRGTKGMHAALADCAVLLLNEDEARALLRQRGQAGESIPEMLKTLQDICQGIVVITQGIDGAAAYDGRTMYSLGSYKQDRVNTLGAGDAFGATIVAAISRDVPLDEALRYASINASSVVSDYGAQSALLTWDEVKRRAADADDFQATAKPA